MSTIHISDDTFERPIYAGNCIATVKTSDSIKVITVRTTAFDECKTRSPYTRIH